jgi:hypothetical protein
MIQISVNQGCSRYRGFAQLVDKTFVAFVSQTWNPAPTWSVAIHMLLDGTHLLSLTLQPEATCISNIDVLHEPRSLFPITRFQQHELDEIVQSMELDAKGAQSWLATALVFERDSWFCFSSPKYQNQPDASCDVPRYSNQSLKVSDFVHDWSQGLPVVISEILFQGTWDPRYFIDAFGEETATIVNCVTGETKKVRVQEYFCGFLNPAERTGIWKLKVAFLSRGD